MVGVPPEPDDAESKPVPKSKLGFWLGCLLVLAGLLINEVSIRTWFYDGVFWSVGKRVATALLQAILLGAGLTSLLLRRRRWSVRRGAVHLLREHPRISGLLVGGVLLSAAALLSALALAWLRPPADETVVFDADSGERLRGFAREDVLLGYRPIADLSVRVLKRAGETSVYEARYSFDGRSRRRTPLAEGKRPPRFAIFMGCSFAFGEGVNDDQTLPYYFAAYGDGYRPYNYGFSGYGTQQMLALLEGGDLPAEIAEESGLLVYVYLSQHVQRAIGSLQVFNGWGAYMPYYFIDGSGTLRRSGNFTSGRPWTALWFWTAGKLRLPQYLGFDYPRQVPEHDELVARMVEEARNRFLKLFPGSRFAVLIYPRGSRDTRLAPRLKRMGIPYFDYWDLLDGADPSLRIAGDGHPTSKAYEIVARRLVADIASGR